MLGLNIDYSQTVARRPVQKRVFQRAEGEFTIPPVLRYSSGH